MRVDIKTRIIPRDHNLSVLRPGANYRLYQQMVEQSKAAIELPHLPLVNGIKVEDQEDIKRKIARSIRFRAWYRFRGQQMEPPPEDLEAYGGHGASRSINQFFSLLKNLFDGYAVGDTIVLPPRKFEEDALIGEFRSETSQFSELVAQEYYGEDRLPARNVVWLGRMPKRELPARILDALTKPSALFLVERSIRDKIYRVAYGNYSTDDAFTSRIFVGSEEYIPEDDIRITSFLNFVAFNMAAMQSGEQSRDFYHAAFATLPPEFAVTLKSNINSPGALELISRSLAPLVISVLLAMALEVGPEAAELVNQAGVEVLNHGQGDECALAVRDEVRTFMRFMWVDEWTQACQEMRRVRDSAQIESNSVVVEPN